MNLNNPPWAELVGGRVLVRLANTHAQGSNPLEFYILEVSPSGKRINAHMAVVGAASWVDVDSIELVEVLPAASSLKETLTSWAILTALRTYSRDVEITIMSDDYEEDSGSYIVVNAPWTQDEEMQYYGATMLKALELAKEDMDSYVKKYGRE